MKTRLQSATRRFQAASGRHSNGSTLVITIVFAGILCLVLGTYLYLASSQSRMVADSQAWNTALALSEAGIEEGMAQLNVNANATNAANYLPSLLANFGRASYGAFYGPRTNTLTVGQNILGSYGVIITTDSPPSVVATGYVAQPITGGQVARTVQVRTQPNPVFFAGMVALTNINLGGNSMVIDSYDSGGTNGSYSYATRLAGGDVATLYGPADLANATVNGHFYVGDGATWNIGANGSVGDLSWTTPGIEDGYLIQPFTIDHPDVTVPFTTGSPLLPGIGTNTWTIGTILGTNYFYDGDFAIQNGQTLFVNGKATLYVTGRFDMKGQNGSFITIAPGGSLDLYVGQASGPPTYAVFSQVNIGGNAGSFRFYGLPTTSSLTWKGGDDYRGTVYAPEAAFTLGGGGNSQNYQGACIVGSINMNGGFNFHFDEYLRRNGPIRGFKLASWQEL